MHNNGSVTLTGGSDGAYTFYNLTIGGAVTSTGAWTIVNNLLISSGSWTAGSFTHSIGANWTNSVGVGGFTAGTSQVSFATGAGFAAHAIAGSTTFYDLTIDASTAPAQVTVSFADGTTQKVTHNLTLLGKAGQLLVLTHSSSAAWTVDNSAAGTVVAQ